MLLHRQLLNLHAASGFLACTRVGLGVGLRQVLKIQPRVNLRGGNVGMPQLLLHGAQIAAGLLHMAG